MFAKPTRHTQLVPIRYNGAAVKRKNIANIDVLQVTPQIFKDYPAKCQGQGGTWMYVNDAYGCVKNPKMVRVGDRDVTPTEAAKLGRKCDGLWMLYDGKYGCYDTAPHKQALREKNDEIRAIQGELITCIKNNSQCREQLKEERAGSTSLLSSLLSMLAPATKTKITTTTTRKRYVSLKKERQLFRKTFKL